MGSISSKETTTKNEPTIYKIASFGLNNIIISLIKVTTQNQLEGLLATFETLPNHSEYLFFLIIENLDLTSIQFKKYKILIKFKLDSKMCAVFGNLREEIDNATINEFTNLTNQVATFRFSNYFISFSNNKDDSNGDCDFYFENLNNFELTLNHDGFSKTNSLFTKYEDSISTYKMSNPSELPTNKFNGIILKKLDLSNTKNLEDAKNHFQTIVSNGNIGGYVFSDTSENKNIKHFVKWVDNLSKYKGLQTFLTKLGILYINFTEIDDAILTFGKFKIKVLNSSSNNNTVVDLIVKKSKNGQDFFSKQDYFIGATSPVPYVIASSEKCFEFFQEFNLTPLSDYDLVYIEVDLQYLKSILNVKFNCIAILNLKDDIKEYNNNYQATKTKIEALGWTILSNKLLINSTFKDTQPSIYKKDHLEVYINSGDYSSNSNGYSFLVNTKIINPDDQILISSQPIKVSSSLIFKSFVPINNYIYKYKGVFDSLKKYFVDGKFPIILSLTEIFDLERILQYLDVKNYIFGFIDKTSKILSIKCKFETITNKYRIYFDGGEIKSLTGEDISSLISSSSNSSDTSISIKIEDGVVKYTNQDLMNIQDVEVIRNVKIFKCNTTMIDIPKLDDSHVLTTDKIIFNHIKSNEYFSEIIASKIIGILSENENVKWYIALENLNPSLVTQNEDYITPLGKWYIIHPSKRNNIIKTQFLMSTKFGFQIKDFIQIVDGDFTYDDVNYLKFIYNLNDVEIDVGLDTTFKVDTKTLFRGVNGISICNDLNLNKSINEKFSREIGGTPYIIFTNLSQNELKTFFEALIGDNILVLLKIDEEYTIKNLTSKIQSVLSTKYPNVKILKYQKILIISTSPIFLNNSLLTFLNLKIDLSNNLNQEDVNYRLLESGQIEIYNEDSSKEIFPFEDKPATLVYLTHLLKKIEIYGPITFLRSTIPILCLKDVSSSEVANLNDIIQRSKMEIIVVLLDTSGITMSLTSQILSQAFDLENCPYKRIHILYSLNFGQPEVTIENISGVAKIFYKSKIDDYYFKFGVLLDESINQENILSRLTYSGNENEFDFIISSVEYTFNNSTLYYNNEVKILASDRVTVNADFVSYKNLVSEYLPKLDKHINASNLYITFTRDINEIIKKQMSTYWTRISTMRILYFSKNNISLEIAPMIEALYNGNIIGFRPITIFYLPEKYNIPPFVFKFRYNGKTVVFQSKLLARINDNFYSYPYPDSTSRYDLIYKLPDNFTKKSSLANKDIKYTTMVITTTPFSMQEIGTIESIKNGEVMRCSLVRYKEIDNMAVMLNFDINSGYYPGYINPLGTFIKNLNETMQVVMYRIQLHLDGEYVINLNPH